MIVFVIVAALALAALLLLVWALIEASARADRLAEQAMYEWRERVLRGYDR